MMPKGEFSVAKTPSGYGWCGDYNFDLSRLRPDFEWLYEAFKRIDSDTGTISDVRRIKRLATLFEFRIVIEKPQLCVHNVPLGRECRHCLIQFGDR
jgi:hypothetical protein